MDEHLYVVTYDIRDPKRWRRIFRVMKGYGEWVQLSVFQCRLNRQRHAELIALLDGMIHHADDHVVLMDVGPADKVAPHITSLGRNFAPIERASVIV